MGRIGRMGKIEEDREDRKTGTLFPILLIHPIPLTRL
jgi:hypothetical protein